MTLKGFHALNSLEQAFIVWQYGTSVGELQDNFYNYTLYQVDDFYVEIKFLKNNFVLSELCGFTAHSSHLDLYIKEIDISRVCSA